MPPKKDKTANVPTYQCEEDDLGNFVSLSTVKELLLTQERLLKSHYNTIIHDIPTPRLLTSTRLFLD